MALANGFPGEHESSSLNEEQNWHPASSCMRQLGAHEIERVIRAMKHAADCGLLYSECVSDLCWKMKYVIRHIRLCEKRRLQECAVCNQVIAIVVFHGFRCREQSCRVPFCQNVRDVVAEYPRGSRYFLTRLDELTYKVIQRLHDPPGQAEEQQPNDDESPGLFASTECIDLVPFYD